MAIGITSTMCLSNLMECNLFTDVRQESKGFCHCQTVLWKSLFALYLASQDNEFIYYVLTVFV